ncbi:MAG TPA: hypothetical protein GX390_02185 [Acholeplasmataceae bacterium]|nr:hypothetical protein [Acholeplasmataceae bacterium]
MSNMNKRFFKNNRDKFALRYPGKYVVISESALTGVYDSRKAALNAASKLQPGAFYIARCTSPKKWGSLITLVFAGIFSFIGFIVFALVRLNPGEVIATDPLVLGLLFCILTAICLCIWLVGILNRIAKKATVITRKLEQVKMALEEIRKDLR